MRLAAQVEEWPSVLAHYREVTVRAAGHDWRLVDMSAFRPPIPLAVHWKAMQRIEPERFRVLYHHVGGVTRGMEVEWRIAQAGKNVEVTILHHFAPRWPWPGAWIARHIVCGFFVHAIADRTLQGIKAAAEEGRVPTRVTDRSTWQSMPIDDITEARRRLHGGGR